MSTLNKPRIAYLSGPSEAVSVYLEWSENQKQNYFGTNYMKQFFQVCRDLSAEAYVITTVAREYSILAQGWFDNREPPATLSFERSYVSSCNGWVVRAASAETHPI